MSFVTSSRMPLIFAFFAALALCSTPADAQNWPRFRGPDGQGMGTVENLPNEWADSNFNWRIELPGTGHSSPVVWDGRIYLSGGNDQSGAHVFMCVDAADGEIIWQKSYASSTYPKHALNSYASGSAAVGEAGVYFCWATPEQFTTIALDHDGEELWRRELGPFVAQHGCGISPTLFDDRIFVFVDSDQENGPGSFVIAMDAQSGETLWKTSHESSVTNYSAPLVYQPDGESPQIVINSLAQGITSYDPETGQQLWQLTSVDGQPLLNLRSVSSPYMAGDYLIASCGSGGGGNSLVAVKPPTSGQSPKLAYRVSRAAPYVPTTLCKDDLLFLFDDAGIATCVDVNTGEVHWQKRLGGGFFSSPVCSDDRVFCVSKSGEVVILAAAKTFQELGRNSLDETCHATPAIADGRLIIRTTGHLYSLGGDAAQ